MTISEDLDSGRYVQKHGTVFLKNKPHFVRWIDEIYPRMHDKAVVLYKGRTLERAIRTSTTGSRFVRISGKSCPIPKSMR